MCNNACLRFGIEVLQRPLVAGRRILEVGSLDVNGSLRPALKALEPAEYLGIDLEMGPGVDVICDVVELVDRYGEQRWDVVVCTEVLEHVVDWQAAASNLKRALAPGGHLVLTTRSLGFPYHPFPVDFWRFEPMDMYSIFGDLRIERVQGDPEMPGVFLHAVRRGKHGEAARSLEERDLSEYAVHSMLVNQSIPKLTSAIVTEFLGKLRAQREWLQTVENSHLRLIERAFNGTGQRQKGAGR